MVVFDQLWFLQISPSVVVDVDVHFLHQVIVMKLNKTNGFKICCY